MPKMPGMKPVQLKEAQHTRLKMLSAMRGLSMAEIVYRALDLYEAQNELPHPTDAQGVPLAYQQKRK